MEIVQVCSASPIDADGETRRALINIGPNTTESRDFESRDKIFRHDAANIADALYNNLPGGTLDRLLIELLDRTRSRLVVSHFPPTEVSNHE